LVFKGFGAQKEHSEGRRPSVRRSYGVRRPAHNKRRKIAQQKAFVTGVNDTVVNPNSSPGQPRPPDITQGHSIDRL
jgi:hypothetical protein